MNYFKLFEIEEKFAVDEKGIQHKYLALQNKYHPDRAELNENKLEFIKIASELNNAYSTLKNPYSRAAHLLKLNAIDITAEQLEIKLPFDLLSKILEKREIIDKTKEFDQLVSIKQQETKVKEEIIKELSADFNEKDLKKAALNAILLKYQDNLLTAINQKLEKCF